MGIQDIDEIIWVRRDSVTYRRKILSDKEEEEWFFVKSFDPHDITRAYRRLFNDTWSFQPNILYLDTQRSLYKSETCMLEALYGLNKDLVPEVHHTDADKLEIYMEYLLHKTYQDLLRTESSNDTKSDCIEEMMNFLVLFHTTCNTHLSQLKEYASKAGVPIRKPSSTEEAIRLEKHLTNITQYLASLNYGKKDFQQCLQRATTDKGKRKKFRKYLQDNGINLRETLDKFIDAGYELSGSLDSLVHGDFQPQNIFYTGEGEKRTAVKICDFTKVRLGSQCDDLVSSLRNIHTYPLTDEWEKFFLNQAQRYFTEMGTSEDKLPTSMASFISSSYKSIIRNFGLSCSLGLKEISWFLNEQQKNLHYNSPNNSPKPKEELIKTLYLSSLKRFLAFYSSDSILNGVIRQPDLKDNLALQFSIIQKIFEACGIDLAAMQDV